VKIDEASCAGCGECVPYCTMGAIRLDEVAVIDQDECVDCGACLRSGVCPTDCITYEPAPWPRALRAAFSDPGSAHPDTGIIGRGTTEMKTNDVTGIYKSGWVGIGIELGRPCLGTNFRDVEKVAQAMAKLGAQFASKNPLTFLMEDKSTGKLKAEVLDEKALSAIVECLFPLEKLPDVLTSLKDVSKDVDTVFTVECISRCEPDGSIPAERMLSDSGVPYYINGKTNVGLGRPRAEGESQ